MQTAALFAAGPGLGVGIAAVLVVSESAAGVRLDDAAGEAAAKRAGVASAASLSP
jgi:hypothetical protein